MQGLDASTRHIFDMTGVLVFVNADPSRSSVVSRQPGIAVQNGRVGRGKRCNSDVLDRGSIL